MQERTPKVGQFLFISPSTNRVVGSFTSLNSRSSDVQQGATGRSDPASGALKTATCRPFDSRMSISNSHLQATGRGQVSTGRVRYSPDLCAERIAKTWNHRRPNTGRVLYSPDTDVERVAKYSNIGRWAPDSLRCVSCFVRNPHRLVRWP